MSDDELFQRLYDESNVPDISEFDSVNFIQYCETLYKMSSEEFKLYFKNNEYEGNVDMQLWYQLIKN